MSRCLVLDTSMWGLVVGVGVEGTLIDFLYFPEQRAVARSMTEYVQTLLQRNGISREDLQEIRVSQGPGSFTGIRMGLAWAYGFSAGTPEIPLLGMSSLEAIAEALHAEQETNQVRTAVFLENKGAAGYVTVVDGSTATYACEIGSDRIATLTGTHELVR
jgi:tRNA threonylcarbamoyladenosine biosynthesis protein TsaB